MPEVLFSDNTVIVNFGLIDRMDLLKRLMNGCGRWTATVADECSASSRVEGLENLSAAPDIFGDPLFPETGAELLDVTMLRLELAEPGDEPHRHLGEAETIAIMTRRGLNAYLVTDDKGAARLARQNFITTVTTWDLMRLAGRTKLVDADTLWGYVQTLTRRHRGAPPAVWDRTTFDIWLDI